MGEVYSARDRRTGEIVALKLLAKRPDDVVARFLSEAQVLADLAHPAIVGYLAHGVDNGLPYLVMRWVNGKTLREHLPDGATLPIDETMVLARRLAEALATIHARGIVHRDVKPSNVILEEGFAARAVLLDFGIAHVPGVELTRRGELVGTPGYMSPEQAQGATIDTRADVFSLGCVLFRCAVGRSPFESSDPLSSAIKLMLEDAPRLVELVPGVPRAFDDLVNRMLARDPAGRPRDGQDLLDAISDSTDRSTTARYATAPVRIEHRRLGASERRIISLVLARRSNWEPTVAAVEAVREVLDERLDPFAMSAAVLADGSIVAAALDDVPHDAVVRAARGALAIAEELGDAQVVLATGRGVMDEDVPVGEIIDRAIALLDIAREGVVVDPTSAGLLAGRFAVEERAEPAGTIHLLGSESRGVRTLLGQPSAFVGRTRELVMLEAMLDECRTESVARVMLVIAEPGVGKSRLCSEFLGRACSRELRVWTAYGDPATRGSPLTMLRSLVVTAADVHDSDSATKRHRKVTACASHLGCSPELAAFLAEIVAPLPDPGVELRAARRDRLLFANRLRVAWEAFVVAAARLGPLAIVLEDLHWGDDRSVELVDGALAAARDLPLFVLALARPEVSRDFPGIFESRGKQELKLLGLTPRASAELVRNALGRDATESVTSAFVARAQGNALFLEELIRGAVAGGDETPESLVAMMGRRISQLDPTARRILRAAAVFGESVASTDGVHALAGGDRLTLERALVRLAKAEVLVANDAGYQFHHALLREAAYATLTEEDRRLAHQLAGEWLEGEGTDSVVLAGHFLASGDRVRARRWFCAAAAGALAKNDLQAALVHAGQVEALDPTPEMLGEIRLIQIEAKLWKDDPAVLAQAAETLTLVPDRSGPWYHAAAGLLFVAGQVADLSKIVAVIGRLEESGPENPGAETVTTQIMAFSMSAWLLSTLGIYDRARRFYARARALESRGDAGALGWLGIARFSMGKFVFGDPWEALLAIRESKSRFMLIGDERFTVLAQLLEGSVLCQLGAYEEAIEILDTASATSNRVELIAARGACQQWKGKVYEALGRFDDALALQRAAQQDVHNTLAYRAIAKAGEASVLLALGHIGEAREAAEQASSELMFAPSHCAQALATLSRACKEDKDAALDAAKRAVAIVDSLGVIGTGEAPVFVALAEAHEARGDRAAARAAVQRGAGLVLARAQKIEEPRYRRDFEERVAANAWLLRRAER